MKFTTRIFSIAMALALTATGALAEYVSFSGNVAASETTAVMADIGGTVDRVLVAAGQHVSEGDVLATLRTTKVYATNSGTVTGIFGEAGDYTENVAATYGAVLYIEPEDSYTIAASTDKSYDADENKFVHVGETIYLSCYSDGDHTGEGVITAVSGTDFTVRVNSGEFLVGETVSVFRNSEYKSSSRIGRGTLSRTDPVAYTGTGSIVNILVNDGDTVNKGDALFETLNGEYDAYYMTGTEIVSPVSGTVAEVAVTADAEITKGTSAFTIYPDNAMWIEASIEETDLGGIAVGDPVEIEFTWNEDSDVVYPGTIAMISSVGSQSTDAESESSSVTYAVYVNFTPDSTVKYGMSAVISSTDDAQTAEQTVEEQLDAEITEDDSDD